MGFCLFCLMVCVGCARMWAFGVVYQVVLCSGCCPFALLGEVLSVFRLFWGLFSFLCILCWVFPFGNKFLFIQKKKEKEKGKSGQFIRVRKS